jgi:hypothetical protein
MRRSWRAGEETAGAVPAVGGAEGGPSVTEMKGVCLHGTDSMQPSVGALFLVHLSDAVGGQKVLPGLFGIWPDLLLRSEP